MDLNLKYQCNPNAGSAKFDKKKGTLVIRMPIVGLTEDSQKVVDENWLAFLKQQEENEAILKKLAVSKLEEDAEARRLKKRIKGDDQENAGDT